MRSKRENPKTGKAHVGGGLRCEREFARPSGLDECVALRIGGQAHSALRGMVGKGGLGARPTLRGPAPIRPLLQQERSRRAP